MIDTEKPNPFQLLELPADATKEEIVETCYLAIMMGGGPALTHVVEVMDSLRECGIED